MYVEIRPFTANHPILIEMLKKETIRMITILYQNGIVLNDDCIKIWVKQYSDEIFYPKIEFDSNRQEIQYDMTETGMIREVHYKRFTGTKGRSTRIDIAKTELVPILTMIDDIIRNAYEYTDGYTQKSD